jgi:hypothetical protein
MKLCCGLLVGGSQSLCCALDTHTLLFTMALLMGVPLSLPEFQETEKNMHKNCRTLSYLPGIILTIDLLS